jgi:hypothetical protein
MKRDFEEAIAHEGETPRSSVDIQEDLPLSSKLFLVDRKRLEWVSQTRPEIV